MANLKGELDKIAGADYVHFDVMDGHFTGNLTFGVEILKAVKRSTKVPVDAHLMVSNPDETVDWYADAGADMITVHYEASTHLHRTLTHLQQRGVKAGVVLNPATPVCVLERSSRPVPMSWWPAPPYLSPKIPPPRLRCCRSWATRPHRRHKPL